MQQEPKFVELTYETGSTATRGAAIGDSTVAFTNQPIMYSDEILEAAKKRFYFLDTVTRRQLPTGHKDWVEYEMTKYLGEAGFTFDSGEKAGSNITNSTMDNFTGVTITPVQYSARITLENYAIRVNVHNLVEKAREQLIYGVADKVDRSIAIAIGDATETTSTVAGAQTLYGGDAVSDATLAAGDVLTTDLVAEAMNALEGTDAYYWSSGTRTLSSGTKNGWFMSTDTPFMLFIGPPQQMALRKDSQFVNASEYGSDEVVLNGEIGKYLGVKIVVTNNIEKVAAGVAGPDGQGNAAVGMTRCLLCVPNKAYCFVWGLAPEISVVPIQWQAAQSIVLECAFAGKGVFHDSVVKVDVANA